MLQQDLIDHDLPQRSPVQQKILRVQLPVPLDKQYDLLKLEALLCVSYPTTNYSSNKANEKVVTSPQQIRPF